MAILVVRVLPNGASLHRTQPGDVVDIVEDGHTFSEGERNSGHYRFITVPGPVADYADLKEPQIVDEVLLAKRGRTLDITQLRTPQMRNKTSFTKTEVTNLVRVR